MSDDIYDAIFRECKTVAELDARFEEEYDETHDCCANDPELREQAVRHMEEAYWKRRREIEQTEQVGDREGWRNVLSVCQTKSELDEVCLESETKLRKLLHDNPLYLERMLTTLHDVAREREYELRLKKLGRTPIRTLFST